jgi:hypothetical protein
MRSTCLPLPDDRRRGGVRDIRLACLVVCDGDGVSGACIRLNEPGDRLGFIEDFFLIESGSTEAVESRVGVLVTAALLRGWKMGGGGSSSSSSERCVPPWGGLNAAIVSSKAVSMS